MDTSEEPTYAAVRTQMRTYGEELPQPTVVVVGETDRAVPDHLRKHNINVILATGLALGASMGLPSPFDILDETRQAPRPPEPTEVQAELISKAEEKRLRKQARNLKLAGR